MNRFVMSCAVWLGLGALSGCSSGGPSTPVNPAKPGGAGQDTSEAVAKVGGEVISLGEFEQQLNQQNPLIRARYTSLEQKKKLLDSLVEREAMVLEARRLGLENDPDMLRGYKKILARHLVNAEFNGKVVKDLDVPEAEIQKYYEENRERYNAPEKVRVYLLQLAAPAGDAGQRKAAKAKAAELHAKLKAAPSDRRLFLELAREHSGDAQTAQTGGDTNFKTREQLVAQYGEKVAEAAFGLKQANDLSEVIESDQGFYILRQAGRQAALDLPLEKVKGQIRTTLFAKARGEAYQRWVDEVKARAGVQVFDEALSRAKVEGGEPAGLPGPKPGEPLAPGDRSPPPAAARDRPGQPPGSVKVAPPPGAVVKPLPAPPPKGDRPAPAPIKATP